MIEKEIQISNELSDVFDALTTPINIISISESGGVSTIVTDSIRIFDNYCNTYDLKDGMIVTIGEKNYQVENVIHTPVQDSFEISDTNISGSTWNVAASFHSGSRSEINEILHQERTDTNKFIRFPLVWYIYNDNRDIDNELYFKSTVNLAFAHFSNITDKTDTRIDNNISKVIMPLVSLFKLWITSTDFNYMFEFNGDGKPLNANEKIFPFYGITDGRKNVLESPTDAIEFEIELQFKKQYIY